MPDFRAALSGGERLYFDGGMGTMLMAEGMPAGVSPEIFGLERPEAIAAVHKQYIQAGARIITTNTFGASRFKLPAEQNPAEVNRHFAALARRCAPEYVFVAGDVGPSGKFMPPLGEITFETMIEAFKEQIAGLAEGGADLIIIETQFDLAEARAIVAACRQVCNLPIAASMTFENGISLTGTPARVFADTMLNMGVDIIGINCSSGPAEMLETARSMMDGLDAPLLVQPNAGLPVLNNGRTFFPMNPEEFAEAMRRIAALGPRALGGCCGTTPAHIKAMIAATSDMPTPCPGPVEPRLSVTSRSRSVYLGAGHRLALIGERINPTGKTSLCQEFQAGGHALAASLAKEQIDKGASIIDVNVGAPMVDESKFLPRLVMELSSRFETPLCIDSPDPAAIAATIPYYPASCLVNSISGEPEKMENIGPLCALYGAPFILLPLKGGGLPADTAERLRIIENLLQKAEALGIPKRLMLVDALALTVSSRPDAARQCLEVIKYCQNTLRLPTVVGLSNISFGMPARELINSAFLTMAAGMGLNACIANPGSIRLQEALAASELLLGRDKQAENFIAGFAGWKPGGSSSPINEPVKRGQAATIYLAVLNGNRDNLSDLLRKELDSGIKPFEIVDKSLIPAITEVGERYNRKEYFLPQLIRSAETMQAAFEQLEPLMENKDGRKKNAPLVVLATVEGDIHDIGKNIVALMLKNHGFEVLDLGKDVKAEEIIGAAAKKKAAIIGLSALMTTTMVKMAETIRLAKEHKLSAKIMVGGAVLNEEYARRIGADGFAENAVRAVSEAKRLLQ